MGLGERSANDLQVGLYHALFSFVGWTCTNGGNLDGRMVISSSESGQALWVRELAACDNIYTPRA